MTLPLSANEIPGNVLWHLCQPDSNQVLPLATRCDYVTRLLGRSLWPAFGNCLEHLNLVQELCLSKTLRSVVDELLPLEAFLAAAFLAQHEDAQTPSNLVGLGLALLQRCSTPFGTLDPYTQSLQFLSIAGKLFRQPQRMALGKLTEREIQQAQRALQSLETHQATTLGLSILAIMLAATTSQDDGYTEAANQFEPSIRNGLQSAELLRDLDADNEFSARVEQQIEDQVVDDWPSLSAQQRKSCAIQYVHGVCRSTRDLGERETRALVSSLIADFTDKAKAIDPKAIEAVAAAAVALLQRPNCGHLSSIVLQATPPHLQGAVFQRFQYEWDNVRALST